MRILLVALVLLLTAGCQKKNESVPAAQNDPAGAPPRAVPANSSLVVAQVLEVSELPEGARPKARLPNLGPELQAAYSVRVEVLEATSGPDGTRSLARPKLTVDAFSEQAPPADAKGRRVRAVMRMTGESGRVQWWISEIRLLDED